MDPSGLSSPAWRRTLASRNAANAAAHSNQSSSEADATSTAAAPSITNSSSIHAMDDDSSEPAGPSTPATAGGMHLAGIGFGGQAYGVGAGQRLGGGRSKWSGTTNTGAGSAGAAGAPIDAAGQEGRGGGDGAGSAGEPGAGVVADGAISGLGAVEALGAGHPLGLSLPPRGRKPNNNNCAALYASFPAIGGAGASRALGRMPHSPTGE